MKKRLIIGLALITILFFGSGVFILKNLKTILSNHEIVEDHEQILARYDNMLYLIKNAQSELYRHQAGYSRDIDGLVEDILLLEETLNITGREYEDFADRPICNKCHSLQRKLEYHRTILDLSGTYLNEYKSKISRIITLRDNALSRSLEREAARDGDEIIQILIKQRDAYQKMNEFMEGFRVASINNSIYSIVITLIVSVVLSVIIVFLTMRSITGPVDMLVSGIKKVSSGDYVSKVDITSHDEIGFLTGTFNSMIDSLNKTTRQKEDLLSELQRLNSTLESRIQKATEELRAAHEFMLRNETLAAVGTLSAGVAHELATPLSSIASYFRLIKKTIPLDDPDDAEVVEVIEKELNRCRNILSGMLDFARPPEKEKSPTDINLLITELITLLKCQPENRNITVREDLDKDLPKIMAVPGQIKQVLMNIMINAFQAMDNGGELSISTYRGEDNSQVVIRVEDTGHGIHHDDLQKIFQPFYTNKKTGTGLGLSISYGIVKGHGGDIEVKSQCGKGTVFHVNLPACAEVESYISLSS